MYTPRSFQVEDLPTIHQLIREYSFGTIISSADGKLVATHLPWMINPEAGLYGTLIAHMARANSQWKSWASETEVLVIFQGPHTYVSPAWYKDDVTVPTWNYAAVHVYGKPLIIDEPARLRTMVEDLIGLHEAPLGDVWDQSKKEPVIETELKGIVGFEIPIDRIEGKWKFNQNRTREDQEGVISVLRQSGNPAVCPIIEIMEANLKKH